MAVTTRIRLLALAALAIIPACTKAQETTDKKASEVSAVVPAHLIGTYEHPETGLDIVPN
jgi:hypothetical protein